MANVAATAFILKDCVLKIGANNYEASVSSVLFSGTNTDSEWGGLTPESSQTFTSYATWKYTIVGAQDWADPESLSNFALLHETETFAAEFHPVDGSAGFAANITMSVPSDIGGARNSVPEFTITGGSTKPTLIVTP